MKKRQAFRMIVMFIVLMIFPTLVKAEDRVDFSVKAILPENQVDPEKTYFDIRMEPAQQQEIEVILYNNGTDEMRVKAAVYNATSNQNGLIVYDDDKEVDSSLKLPLTEIVEFEEEEITIPAGGSKTAIAKISMPDEEFDGIILGGLHFEKMMEEQESEGMQIQNRYAYVIGLQLSENEETVEPVLNLLSIEPKLINYRTAIQATIQNSQPVLMQDLTVIAEVYKDGEDAPFKESESEINLAPNSTIDYTIDWQNEQLKEGTYLLKLKVDDGTNSWEWEELFVIGKEARQLNSEAVELEKDDPARWYLSGFGGLLFIIIILVFYIRKLKRETASSSEEV